MFHADLIADLIVDRWPRGAWLAVWSGVGIVAEMHRMVESDEHR